jgi:hypothetical protein
MIIFTHFESKMIFWIMDGKYLIFKFKWFIEKEFNPKKSYGKKLNPILLHLFYIFFELIFLFIIFIKADFYLFPGNHYFQYLYFDSFLL